MTLEISAIISRTEKRIEDHLHYIQKIRGDKALEKAAKAYLAQMLVGLKRLETYRDKF